MTAEFRNLDEAITKTERMLRSWAETAPHEGAGQSYILQGVMVRPFHTWSWQACQTMVAEQVLITVAHAMAAIVGNLIHNFEPGNRQAAREFFIGKFAQSLAEGKLEIAATFTRPDS